MIVIVDERETVLDGYTSWFCREGVSAAGLAPSDFRQWVDTAAEPDIDAVEAFLLGDFQNRGEVPVKIRSRSSAAVIAMNDSKSLSDTLELFAAGVDDVVRKPVHVREILARIKAISRRMQLDVQAPLAGRIRVFSDGRDPEIDGEPLPLPRRERRILEYLMANKGRRVTKSQIFNFVYGLFDDGIDENVIESHISKLRKRLRQRLGTDPIDSQRFLGYRLTHE
jgi:DNA-binding response OmpR family regulator